MSEAGMEGSGQVPSEQVPQAATGPGAHLAAQRQAVGWSVEQVANQLNLAPRQVQAMEDDNFAALPGIVIARGFVRAYAKLLKLDPVPLLAMISEQAAPSPEALEVRRALSATFTESNLPMAKRAGSRKWLVAILLLAALAAAGWLALQEGWIARLPSEFGGLTAPASQVAQPEPGALEAASGVPMGQADNGVPTADPAVQLPAETAQMQAPAAASAPAPAPAPVDPAPARATTVAPAMPEAAVKPAAGDSAPASAPAARPGDKLVLKLREASWIEVRREDGVSVASRLVPAGTTESFDVGPGASLVVGNAAGVDARFRNQVLDLNGDAKNNVARVKLK